jgi:Fe-S oxidoreductase
MKEIGIFLGCITKAKEEIAPSFESLFQKTSVSYKFIMEKNCCGAPYFLSGMTEEFKQNAEKFRDELKKQNVDTLVLNCPYCHSFIKNRYPKYGVEPGVNILHITTFLRKLIEEGSLKVKRKLEKETVYHDPCYLGRQGEGIYEDPREVLKKSTSKLLEFELSKEETTCCGGNSSIVTYLPHLFTEVSKEKINMQVIPLGAKVLTTACPHCYFNFSNANKELENPIEVKHIVQILDEIT